MTRPRRPFFALHAAAPADAEPARAWWGLAWVVLGLFVIAAAFMALGPHTIGDNFAETDFYGGYAEGARALQRGQIDPGRYGVVGPGYEVALALTGFLVRDLLLAAELLSVVSLGVGLAAWILLLGRRVHPRLAALTALLLAVNPIFFRYGFSATNDALAFALQAISLLLLLTRDGRRAALGAGVLAAAAFLTRYNAVVLLPAGLLAIALRGTVHQDRRGAGLAFAVGFLVVVAPWIAFSLAGGGGFQSQFHHNIAYDVFARGRGIVWDEYQRTLQPEFRSLADVIARDPGAVLQRELYNVWDHLRLDARTLVGGAVAICALLGLIFAALDGTWRRLWPLGLTAMLFFLSLVPIFHSPRYGLPLLPVYALLAASAFTSGRFALAAGRRHPVWLKALLVAIPVGISVDDTRASTRHMLTQLPVEVLENADRLRTLARPGDRVISRKPHIAFHAGIEPLAFPFTTTLPELGDYARRHGARWLYFSWPEAEMRPSYGFLLDTLVEIPGLTPRHHTRRPAILYEIGPGFGTEPAWLGNDTLRMWHQLRGRQWVDPLHLPSLRALAAMEMERGEEDVARGRLAYALARRPDFAPGWMLLGEIALRADDAAAARQAFERVVALEPSSPDGRLGLGWAHLVGRDVRRAAELWRPVIEAADPSTLERMIDVYQAIGDAAAETRARTALARALGGPR